MGILSCLLNLINPVTEEDKGIKFIKEIEIAEHQHYCKDYELKDALWDANSELLFFEVGLLAMFYHGVNDPDKRKEVMDAYDISHNTFGFWYHGRSSKKEVFNSWQETIREAQAYFSDKEIDRKRKDLIIKVNKCYADICEHLKIECNVNYLNEDIEANRQALREVVNKTFNPTNSYVVGWMKAVIKVMETVDKDKVELIYDLDELVFSKAIVGDKIVYSITRNEELRCVFDSDCVLLEGEISTFKLLVAEMNIFYRNKLKR